MGKQFVLGEKGLIVGLLALVTVLAVVAAVSMNKAEDRLEKRSESPEPTVTYTAP